MTEEEAREKTCVQTLAPVHDQLGGVTYGPACCIAARCMAWRWRAEHRARISGPAGQDFLTDDARAYADPAAYWTVTPLPSDGYCGVAGSVDAP